jgi:glutathione S-transferase
MELGYFQIQGLAEPARWSLAFLGLPYKEHNPTSREDAQATIAKHPFDFPNVPYIIDGDVYVTESSAIPIYLAQKAKRPEFLGKQGLDQVKHQELLGVANDIRDALFPMFHSDTPVEIFKAKEEVVKRKLGLLSKFLGSKDFFLGYPTYADLHIVNLFTILNRIATPLKVDSLVCKHENLKALQERVKALPGLKEYLASEGYQHRPFLPPVGPKLHI